MTLNYRVVYSDDALNDIDEIYEHIKNVAWYRSADKWVAKIYEKTEQLALFPNGNPAWWVSSKYRTAKIGKYIAIYKVDERRKIVIILRVLYAKRRLGDILAG